MPLIAARPMPTLTAVDPIPSSSPPPPSPVQSIPFIRSVSPPVFKSPRPAQPNQYSGFETPEVEEK